jgi:regulator of sigma E protease
LFQSAPIWMWLVGFLLVLGPLVTLHEFGHYLVGRLFGVKADAFSIGFGTEIAGFNDKRGTRWKLSALPLGGYVQFAGDMNPASQPSEEWLNLPPEEREKTFQSKALWKRALIVAAGPVMNFVIAIAILSAFNFAYGRLVIPPVVAVVERGSAADKLGIAPGDRFVTVDGTAVESFDQLRDIVAPNPGARLNLVMDRKGQRRALTFLVPSVAGRDRFGNTFRIGQLGVGSADGEFIPVGLGEAVVLGVEQTGDTMKLMVQGVWQIITGKRSVEELGGPIKIAKYSGEQLSLGWRNFVGFAALISINLAFINLLPIPALDGGHLAFYAAEAVRRKPASPRSQEWAFRTGIALVLALMLFVTINDIVSLPIFGS